MDVVLRNEDVPEWLKYNVNKIYNNNYKILIEKYRKWRTFYQCSPEYRDNSIKPFAYNKDVTKELVVQLYLLKVVNAITWRDLILFVKDMRLNLYGYIIKTLVKKSSKFCMSKGLNQYFDDSFELFSPEALAHFRKRQRESSESEKDRIEDDEGPRAKTRKLETQESSRQESSGQVSVKNQHGTNSYNPGREIEKIQPNRLNKESKTRKKRRNSEISASENASSSKIKSLSRKKIVSNKMEDIRSHFSIVKKMAAIHKNPKKKNSEPDYFEEIGGIKKKKHATSNSRNTDHKVLKNISEKCEIGESNTLKDSITISPPTNSFKIQKNLPGNPDEITHLGSMLLEEVQIKLDKIDNISKSEKVNASSSDGYESKTRNFTMALQHQSLSKQVSKTRKRSLTEKKPKAQCQQFREDSTASKTFSEEAPSRKPLTMKFPVSKFVSKNDPAAETSIEKSSSPKMSTDNSELHESSSENLSYPNLSSKRSPCRKMSSENSLPDKLLSEKSSSPRPSENTSSRRLLENTLSGRPSENTSPQRSSENTLSGRSSENTSPQRSSGNTSPQRLSGNTSPQRSSGNTSSGRPSENTSSRRSESTSSRRSSKSTLSGRSSESTLSGRSSESTLYGRSSEISPTSKPLPQNLSFASTSFHKSYVHGTSTVSCSTKVSPSKISAAKKMSSKMSSAKKMVSNSFTDKKSASSAMVSLTPSVTSRNLDPNSQVRVSSSNLKTPLKSDKNIRRSHNILSFRNYLIPIKHRNPVVNIKRLSARVIKKWTRKPEASKFSSLKFLEFISPKKFGKRSNNSSEESFDVHSEISEDEQEEQKVQSSSEISAKPSSNPPSSSRCGTRFGAPRKSNHTHSRFSRNSVSNTKTDIDENTKILKYNGIIGKSKTHSAHHQEMEDCSLRVNRLRNTTLTSERQSLSSDFKFGEENSGNLFHKELLASQEQSKSQERFLKTHSQKTCSFQHLESFGIKEAMLENTNRLVRHLFLYPKRIVLTNAMGLELNQYRRIHGKTWNAFSSWVSILSYSTANHYTESQLRKRLQKFSRKHGDHQKENHDFLQGDFLKTLDSIMINNYAEPESRKRKKLNLEMGFKGEGSDEDNDIVSPSIPMLNESPLTLKDVKSNTGIKCGGKHFGQLHKTPPKDRFEDEHLERNSLLFPGDVSKILTDVKRSEFIDKHNTMSIDAISKKEQTEAEVSKVDLESKKLVYPSDDIIQEKYVCTRCSCTEFVIKNSKISDKSDDFQADESCVILAEKSDDILADESDCTLAEKSDDILADESDVIIAENSDFMISDGSDGFVTVNSDGIKADEFVENMDKTEINENSKSIEVFSGENNDEKSSKDSKNKKETKDPKAADKCRTEVSTQLEQFLFSAENHHDLLSADVDFVSVEQDLFDAKDFVGRTKDASFKPEAQTCKNDSRIRGKETSELDHNQHVLKHAKNPTSKDVILNRNSMSETSDASDKIDVVPGSSETLKTCVCKCAAGVNPHTVVSSAGSRTGPCKSKQTFYFPLPREAWGEIQGMKRCYYPRARGGPGRKMTCIRGLGGKLLSARGLNFMNRSLSSTVVSMGQISKSPISSSLKNDKEILCAEVNKEPDSKASPLSFVAGKRLAGKSSDYPKDLNAHSEEKTMFITLVGEMSKITNNVSDTGKHMEQAEAKRILENTKSKAPDQTIGKKATECEASDINIDSSPKSSSKEMSMKVVGKISEVPNNVCKMGKASVQPFVKKVFDRTSNSSDKSKASDQSAERETICDNSQSFTMNTSNNFIRLSNSARKPSQSLTKSSNISSGSAQTCNTKVIRNDSSEIQNRSVELSNAVTPGKIPNFPLGSQQARAKENTQRSKMTVSPSATRGFSTDAQSDLQRSRSLDRNKVLCTNHRRDLKRASPHFQGNNERRRSVPSHIEYEATLIPRKLFKKTVGCEFQKFRKFKLSPVSLQHVVSHHNNTSLDLRPSLSTNRNNGTKIEQSDAGCTQRKDPIASTSQTKDSSLCCLEEKGQVPKNSLITNRRHEFSTTSKEQSANVRTSGIQSNEFSKPNKEKHVNVKVCSDSTSRLKKQDSDDPISEIFHFMEAKLKNLDESCDELGIGQNPTDDGDVKLIKQSIQSTLKDLGDYKKRLLEKDLDASPQKKKKIKRETKREKL